MLHLLLSLVQNRVCIGLIMHVLYGHQKLVLTQAFDNNSPMSVSATSVLYWTIVKFYY
jgi:hypothetical protein